jgi:tRNA threonylcarbamoyladenosine biosynthesis protein TsaB
VVFEYEWTAERTLARGLLKYLQDHLAENGSDINNISAIGVFQGPGSFTGLRIGLTILNTIASTQKIPIVGGTGENWREVVLEKIKSGENDQIVLPFYGGEANITSPIK